MVKVSIETYNDCGELIGSSHSQDKRVCEDCTWEELLSVARDAIRGLGFHVPPIPFYDMPDGED